jgi:hypothetical protein
MHPSEDVLGDRNIMSSIVSIRAFLLCDGGASTWSRNGVDLLHNSKLGELTGHTSQEYSVPYSHAAANSALICLFSL